MKKNIIKIGFGFAIALLGLFASGAQANASTSFNTHPNDCETIRVGNYSTGQGTGSVCWPLSSVSGSDGDTINVRIYIHNSGSENAQNVRVRLSPQNSSEGSNHTFSGSISASNASTASGNVFVNTNSNERIEYGAIKFFIMGQESSLPNGQTGAEIFSQNGLNLGAIPHTGNEENVLVLAFRVIAEDEEEIYACNDGEDNDGDGYTDFPSDPGCSSYTDDNEYNASTGSVPVVSTNNPSGIESNSATLRGSFSSAYTTTAWFEYGTTNNLGQTTTGMSVGTGSGEFTRTISGLNSNTTYYYRAYASNQFGQSETSNLRSFTTSQGSQTYACNDGIDNDGDGYTDFPSDPGCTSNTDNDEYNAVNNQAPEITTENEEEVTEDSAILNGYFDANGYNTTVFFDYGETQSFGYRTTLRDVGTNGGSFDQEINNLRDDTTYYYRAGGFNSYGTSYGVVREFRTDDDNNNSSDELSITTRSASFTTQNAAILNADYETEEDAEIWFTYGETTSMNEETARVDVSDGDDNFSQSIENLEEDTLYYFRAIIRNDDGETEEGQRLSFRTERQTSNEDDPNVTTLNASNITDTEATLRMNWDANNDPVTVWFEWGTNANNLNYTTESRYEGEGSDETSIRISNLEEGETYYFRAVARNSYDTFRDGILSFTTDGDDDDDNDDDRPEVRTLSALSINQTSATLRGDLDSNGSGTTVWFRYGTSNSSLFLSTSSRYKGSSDGVFLETITGLIPNRTYYYQAVAQNNDGIDYGNIYSFVTGGGQSDVQEGVFTVLATSVGSNSAQINGVLRNSNYGVGQTVWFEYGTTTSLGNTTAVQSVGSSEIFLFNQRITGLSSNTRYYFRALSRDNNGNILSGSIISFVTARTGTPAPTESVSGDNIISLDIETTNNSICRENSVDFVLSYQNETNRTVNNSVIRFVLPEEIIFDQSSTGSYSENERTLIITPGALGAGETGTVFIEGFLDKNIIDNSFIASGSFSYTNPTTGINEEESAYTFVNVDNDCRNSLSASSIFGNSDFLPDTLVEWLITILVIFGLVFVGRKLYFNRKV